MGDPKDYEQAPTDTGEKLVKSWKPFSWSEISRRLGVSQGRAKTIHDLMLIKLQNALLEDDELREWIDKNDYEIPEHQRKKFRKRNDQTSGCSTTRPRDERSSEETGDQQ